MKKRKNPKKRKPKGKRLSVLNRSCGDCTVCCTIMGVPEMNKGHREECSKANNGCTIYASRPRSCREFKCLWLQGLGELEHRPDQSGLLFTVTGKDGILGKAGEVVIAHEVEPGSSDGPNNAALITAFAVHAKAVIVCREDGSRSVRSNDPVILRRAQNAARGIS